MPELTIRCPYCKARNTLTAVNVPEYEDLSCSKCHQQLGNMGQLVRDQAAACPEVSADAATKPADPAFEPKGGQVAAE